ncbi:hypothetical protein LJY78_002375 [Vibrio cholerae]|nr:hypothetical protein [Vibrio cholerae]
MALITEAQLNMANLNEEPVWEAGIYQFETTDPVEGGPEGIDNKPTRQLANRTAYLKKEQGKIKEDVLLLNQQWSENANYDIGQEVVRNGLRYIARAASGPDNGGAVTPSVTEGKWDPVLPQAYTLRNPTQWVKIAVVAGGTATDGDAVSISVFGGSNYASTARFSADILLGERGDSVLAVIEPKTLALNNPTFYTKRIAAFTYELWFKRETSFPSVLTIVQKSSPLVSVTKVGILETSSTAPVDITLVPYDTGYQFASIPVGMEVALDTPPPTNDPRFGFIKLTYNDPYNAGVLTSQTLSGSAPELVSTAVISDTRSPINGQTIDMINTMGTFIRPGVTAGVRKSSQNKAHVHDVAQGGTQGVGAYSLRATSWTGTYMQTVSEGGDEANPYFLSRIYYKRYR